MLETGVKPLFTLQYTPGTCKARVPEVFSLLTEYQSACIILEAISKESVMD
jgi:hypothetical protein